MRTEMDDSQPSSAELYMSVGELSVLICENKPRAPT